ncbi:MAG: methyltransferase [Armatimonadetes bacterium]|nr:methyltransferase [Armatimonadota bacterium]
MPETGVNAQYFAADPRVPSAPRELHWRDGEREWVFLSDRGVFSKDRIDPGTRLLIDTVALPHAARFADWGCGYGVVGIRLAARDATARGVLVDVNRRAVFLAAENARRNGVANVSAVVGDGLSGFAAKKVLGAIVSNPPIRAGRTVLRQMLAESHARLQPHGQLWLVARTQQGARSLARDMEQLVGPVETVSRKSGYRVLRATRCET